MDTATTLLLSVALAMDCFAVSIVIGMTAKRFVFGDMAKTAVSFGLFQCLMPIIGWILTAWCVRWIGDYGPFVAFALLEFVGVKMLYEALSKRGDSPSVDVSRWSVVLWLAVATSLDALAVGMSYGVLDVSIIVPSVVIGLGSVLFSIIGNAIGVLLGNIFGRKAEVLGGIILVLLGLKVVAEHIGFFD